MKNEVERGKIGMLCNERMKFLYIYKRLKDFSSKQKDKMFVDFNISEKINWAAFAESFSKIEGRANSDSNHLCPFSSSLVPFDDAFAYSSEVEIWK